VIVDVDHNFLRKTKHFSNMLARPKANLTKHGNLAA
jgi:hypothetical protein